MHANFFGIRIRSTVVLPGRIRRDFRDSPTIWDKSKNAGVWVTAVVVAAIVTAVTAVTTPTAVTPEPMKASSMKACGVAATAETVASHMNTAGGMAAMPPPRAIEAVAEPVARIAPKAIVARTVVALLIMHSYD